jgi:hypothetical protein
MFVGVADDLEALAREEIERRLDEIRKAMAPLDRELAELRAQRDVLLTEVRRRERLDQRQRRAGVRESMRSGELATIAELIEQAGEGSFEDYAYNLKTGGEVRLGYPGARAQTLTFTDGRQSAQAGDLAAAARYFDLGWELGTPGRPGVRVHFPGTRQERLVPVSDVFARPRL